MRSPLGVVRQLALALCMLAYLPTLGQTQDAPDEQQLVRRVVVRRQIINPVFLIANTAVQKELELTDQQTYDVQGIVRECGIAFQKELAAAGFSPEKMRKVPAEDRNVFLRQLSLKRVELIRELLPVYQRKLDEHLSPTQAERLHQIVLQAAEGSVFRREDVKKALGLSEEQDQQLSGIATEYGRKIQQLIRGQGGVGGVASGRVAKLRELRTEQQERSIAVLTAEQGEKLTEMKGPPFDLSLLRPAAGKPASGPASPSGKAAPAAAE